MLFATLGRRSFSALLTAASLLLAAPGRGADAPPAKSPAKPAPARRAPARPVASAPARPVASAAAPPAAARPVEAPCFVTLVGTVLSPKGKPRPGVCVFPTTNPRLLAVTDAYGIFQLQVPVAATLRLQADYAGLGSTRFDVDGQHPQAIRVVLGQ